MLVAKDATSSGDMAKLFGKPVKTYKIGNQGSPMTPPFLEKNWCQREWFSMGYQTVNESLQWLRSKLRYGNNPPYEDVKYASEIGNPQPNSYVQYDKDMEEVQRLNGDGSENSNQIQ